MTWLVDTSILARLSNADDLQYPRATDAVEALHDRGETLQTAPQNLLEFRNCATRPVSSNGLGLTAADAQARAEEFEFLFPLAPEVPEIYLTWKSLAQASGVIGKQVYDLRLVAVCQVHRITDILTFNVEHLARFATLVPHVRVSDPDTVLRS